MSRPRIKIRYNPIDWVFEIISLCSLIASVIIPIIYFSKLPGTIPIHYNVLGQPDSFGPTILILLFPFIGIITYLGMTILSKYPYIFNYPVEINDQNAIYCYRIGIRTILVTKMIVCLLLSYISYSHVYSLLSGLKVLNILIILFFILVIAIIPIISVIMMIKKK